MVKKCLIGRYAEVGNGQVSEDTEEREFDNPLYGDPHADDRQIDDSLYVSSR